MFYPKVRKANTWGKSNWHRMSEARQCEEGLYRRGWSDKGCQSLSKMKKVSTKGGGRGSDVTGSHEGVSQ